jgi:membrane-bound lytic murein transglycosylase F
MLILTILLFVTESRAQEYNKKYDLYFYKYSKMYFGLGLDYKYFKSQAIAESALKPYVVSPVGAIGLMQIMPKTWKDIKSKQTFLLDITDPESNICAGIYYDRYLWNNWKSKRTFEDRLALMYSSYNGGLKNVLNAQNICICVNTCDDCNSWKCISSYADQVDSWIHEESLNYVERIFKIYERIQGE